MNSATVTELRANIAAILEMLGDDPLRVTSRGKAAAYLLGTEKYKEMLERMELLEDTLIYDMRLAEVREDRGVLVNSKKKFESLTDAEIAELCIHAMGWVVVGEYIYKSEEDFNKFNEHGEDVWCLWADSYNPANNPAQALELLWDSEITFKINRDFSGSGISYAYINGARIEPKDQFGKAACEVVLRAKGLIE